MCFCDTQLTCTNIDAITSQMISALSAILSAVGNVRFIIPCNIGCWANKYNCYIQIL